MTNKIRRERDSEKQTCQNTDCEECPQLSGVAAADAFPVGRQVDHDAVNQEAAYAENEQELRNSRAVPGDGF